MGTAPLAIWFPCVYDEAVLDLPSNAEAVRGLMLRDVGEVEPGDPNSIETFVERCVGDFIGNEM